MRDVMIDEVWAYYQSKRGTHGAEQIYEQMGGLIPRRLITETLQPPAQGEKRPRQRRYEFVAPQVVYSDDFIKVRPSGRVLRVQDERARLIFGWEHRDHWPDSEVARFVAAVFQKYGPPYFFKHDLGSEFRGGIFQSMLRGVQVIALPSPGGYPQYNGKHERTNRSVRAWLVPTTQDDPTLNQVIEEMHQSLLDENGGRRKEILGGRTPEEVWANEKRVVIERETVYSEWDALRQKLLGRTTRPTRLGWIAEMEAMRLAAIAMLRKYRLIRYSSNPEVPEVST